MNEDDLQVHLSQGLVSGWEIIPTGSGFLITTDWHWPNDERIEIYVRTVGDREDLFVVSDGGEVFNFLFSQGIDLTKDAQGMKILNTAAERCESKIVDYQIVKGANPSELPRAVRLILEAVKDTSFLLWHKLNQGAPIH
jgi:hypothetical protein